MRSAGETRAAKKNGLQKSRCLKCVECEESTKRNQIKKIFLVLIRIRGVDYHFDNCDLRHSSALHDFMNHAECINSSSMSMMISAPRMMIYVISFYYSDGSASVRTLARGYEIVMSLLLFTPIALLAWLICSKSPKQFDHQLETKTYFSFAFLCQWLIFVFNGSCALFVSFVFYNIDLEGVC
ncbi:hypothetical protein L1887_05622 [Cichorium endivia]|nr:hypothetical protein L1887_05622 [Cichorium endivia]